MRQIVLDTETTGLRVEEGHRIIEIGCIELIDRKLTGGTYHQYINPDREIEAAAIAIHGITNESLIDKPFFSAVAEEFIHFISGSELIIHNASFDVGFINYELNLSQKNFKALKEYCRIFDTLSLARQLHVGSRNSLDALCKRYGVDNSKRDVHGALLDAHLLAEVYLAMTGGQGSFFDILTDTEKTSAQSRQVASLSSQRKQGLVILKANTDELASHQQNLQAIKQQGKCLWLSEDCLDGISK